MAAQPRALLLLAACCCCFFFFVMSRHLVAAVSFSYDFSEQGVLDSAGLKYIGDAGSSATGDRIVLTKVSNWSTGLVAYPQPVRLWDPRTGKAASFSTSFSFAINSNSSARGDGMAFFIRPFPASLPPDSRGAFFGLFSYPGPDRSRSSPPAVGVEFDTFWNTDWDPADITGRDHVGIDVNEIHSVNYTRDLTEGVLSGTMSANVTYDAASKLLMVTLRLANGSTHAVQAKVDFKDAGLPQDAAVGFSATTGDLIQSNELLSWSFSSRDPPSNKIRLWVIVLLSVASVFVAASVAALLWVHRQRRGNISVDIPIHIPLPVARKFTYKELSAATSNFSEDRKLGQGAFGEVYTGELTDPLMPLVAVKKLKMQKEEQAQKQTRKDYVTEITTLGRLSHRNLVRLVGWCHGGGRGNGELLLVYELVTNRSLDEHLHGPDSERLLTWPERYKIVRGIGSAVEYLHTSYQNPILHRDIKPSNVMLDDDFMAKLGDFGLVRQVDPGQGSSLKDTVMIGTRVYMDPVCMRTDTVSTASDMYSFGVLLLEIGTGLKPAEVHGPGGLLSNTLINAVQESYAKGEVLRMADQRLNGDFDKRQMERVLVVGLLCVQQQREHRLKIRNAVNLLSDLSHPVPRFLS